ncbi:MAG: 5'-methylthioadenosine/S-adenosylhomocysteine nucleosidase [Verrucomicrobiota bacterium]
MNAQLRFGFLSITLAFGLIFSGCETTYSGSQLQPSGSLKSTTTLVDSEPLTAVVAAYRPEIEALIQEIERMPEGEIYRVIRHKGVTYHLGTVYGEPIVLFVTGMSIANAAMTIQMALDYFPVERVLYAGIAGAVNPELNLGDVVVPARWYYHDEHVYFNPSPEDSESYILADYYENNSPFFKKLYEGDPHLPRYTNFGMIHPDEVSIIMDGWDRPRRTAYFSATPELLELSEAALKHLPDLTVGERVAQLTVGGNGVTGSVFLDNAEYRKWTRDVFKAEVTEMESAAVGQVCMINEVPWVIIRGVSDLAGGQKGKNDENIYDGLASEHAAKWLFALLKEIAAAN